MFTLPHPFRARLTYDAPLLGAVTRLFVDSVLGWYQRHLRTSTRELVQGGAVVAVQRASSDLKLNPHLHAVFLDGVYVPRAYGTPEFYTLRRAPARPRRHHRPDAGCPASFITAAHQRRHPLALRRETLRTSSPWSSAAAPPQRAPRQRLLRRPRLPPASLPAEPPTTLCPAAPLAAAPEPAGSLPHAERQHETNEIVKPCNSQERVSISQMFVYEGPKLSIESRLRGLSEHLSCQLATQETPAQRCFTASAGFGAPMLWSRRPSCSR